MAVMVTYPYACMTYIVSPLADLGGGISWRPPTYSLFSTCSDVLRRVKMVARPSEDAAAALQRVADAVTKRLVEEPVDDRVDGAVRVSQPQGERQNAGLAGVEAEIDAQRDDVVRQPARDKYDDDRHQEADHRATTAIDGVPVRIRRHGGDRV